MTAKLATEASDVDGQHVCAAIGRHAPNLRKQIRSVHHAIGQVKEYREFASSQGHDRSSERCPANDAVNLKVAAPECRSR